MKYKIDSQPAFNKWTIIAIRWIISTDQFSEFIDICNPHDKEVLNSTLGMIPDNYICVRNAVIDFYKELPANKDWKSIGKVYSIDKKLMDIMPAGISFEKRWHNIFHRSALWITRI